MKKEYIIPTITNIFQMEPFCLNKESNPDPEDPILAPYRPNEDYDAPASKSNGFWDDGEE